MTYLIQGLDPSPFTQLFMRSDEDLARDGILAVYAMDDDYPCRIALAGAAVGDRLLLLTYVHQATTSPYRASHAIYVAQGSKARGIYKNAIPSVMQTRILSIRAFDGNDMMIDADLVDGNAAESLITHLLANPQAAYLHIHFAKRGCFAATVLRA